MCVRSYFKHADTLADGYGMGLALTSSAAWLLAATGTCPNANKPCSYPSNAVGTIFLVLLGIGLIGGISQLIWFRRRSRRRTEKSGASASD